MADNKTKRISPVVARQRLAFILETIAHLNHNPAMARYTKSLLICAHIVRRATAEQLNMAALEVQNGLPPMSDPPQDPLYVVTDSSKVFMMSGPLRTLQTVFALHPDALSRIRAETEVHGFCMLYGVQFGRCKETIIVMPLLQIEAD